MLLSDVCLLRTSGLTREQRGLGRLKLALVSCHITRDSDSGFKVKGQLVADVLNSQHAGIGATWRINTKILTTCKGRRHIVAAARLQLVLKHCYTHTQIRQPTSLNRITRDIARLRQQQNNCQYGVSWGGPPCKTFHLPEMGYRAKFGGFTSDGMSVHPELGHPPAAPSSTTSVLKI